MEALLKDMLLANVEVAGPWNLYQELSSPNPRPNTIVALQDALESWMFYDPRVVNIVSQLPENDQRAIKLDLSDGWLPELQRPLYCRTYPGFGFGHVHQVHIEHNTRMLKGEPDVEIDNRILADPRVLAPTDHSRDEILNEAEHDYIPRLFEWLPDLTCVEADDLENAASPNETNLYRFAAVHLTTCEGIWNVSSWDEVLARCLAILREEQWWDFPGDPCDIKAAWPGMLSPTARCSATCDMRSPFQCSRMAKSKTTFCAWHESVGVTMHMRGSKRAFTDVTPQQYANPQGLALYPQTKRAVSAMTFAANPFAAKPVGFYLPVLRYEGLYYSASSAEGQWCGKFYFYEPESHLHLYLGNSRCFGSKVHAYVELCAESKCPPPTKIQGRYANIALDAMTATGQEAFPGSVKLLKTIVESRNLDDYDLERCKQFAVPDVSAAWNNFVLSRYWSVYLSQRDLPHYNQNVIPALFPSDNPKASPVTIGEFDFLDQPICNMARGLQIDTVVLQHEIGSHDCVTEIIDTRTNYREHLHDLGSIFVRAKEEASKYPKIWFPHDDHLVYIGLNMPQAQMSDEIRRVFASLYPPIRMDCEEAQKESLADYLFKLAQDFKLDGEDWQFYDMVFVEIHAPQNVLVSMNWMHHVDILPIGKYRSFSTRKAALAEAISALRGAKHVKIMIRYMLTNDATPVSSRTALNVNGTDVLNVKSVTASKDLSLQDRFVLKCVFDARIG